MKQPDTAALRERLANYTPEDELEQDKQEQHRKGNGDEGCFGKHHRGEHPGKGLFVVAWAVNLRRGGQDEAEVNEDLE